MGEAEVWLHSFLTLAVAGGEGKNPVSTDYKVGLSIQPVWTVVTEKYLSQISCLAESNMYCYRLTRTDLTLAVIARGKLGW
jgi:hypothetical protein